MIDRRNGLWVNGNLGEALIPTHRDVPPMEVIFVEDDDPSDPGAIKGLSEVGVMGPGPAIANANAIRDATGIRIRKLPIRIEDLFATPDALCNRPVDR